MERTILTPGTIELVRGGKRLRELFPWFTGGPWTHAMIHVGDNEIFDMHPPKSSRRAYPERWRVCRRMRFIPKFHVSRGKLIAWCNQNEGQWYDFVKILAAAWALMRGDKTSMDQSGHFCYSMVGKAMVEALGEPDFATYVDDDLVRGVDIDDYLSMKKDRWATMLIPAGPYME